MPSVPNFKMVTPAERAKLAPAPFGSHSEALAWAAGFMEGEACFGWYWHRGPGRNGSLVISVGQNEREPLDWLTAIFGVGLIHPKQNAKRVAWEWRVNGHAAKPVMQAVAPLMSARRQQRIREALAEHGLVQQRIAERKASPTCPHGHLWAEHAGHRTKGIGAGKRYCKACSREAAAARQRAST